jgi:hypothetical protein
MALATHTRETRLWLANALDKTADWRYAKAGEFQDDPRNVRSGAALRMAAYYLRGVEESPAVQRVAELVHDSAASDIDLVGPNYSNGFPGPESERVAGRYCFDHFAGTPDAESHEELVADLYRALLRDVSERPHSAGSPLGRRIRADEVPVDPVVTTLGELRELLRDAWAQRRTAQLVEISQLLGVIADTARAEGDADGRLPAFNQPTRLPMLRRQLSIALKAYGGLGGSTINAAEKLVNEPPLFALDVVSGVISALDEVAFAMDHEASSAAA